ncbi:MAG: DUF3499 domain-containing protein [Nocardioides sp.]|nr:DUF3499 domain-containing protein [Nocardioides sp.]
MSHARRCSRSGCGRVAVATLTYVYAEQMAVLGPLATYAEPHAYDLCGVHGERLSVPRGWEVMRLATDWSTPAPSSDDLLALADAVREAARPAPAASRPVAVLQDEPRTGTRRGHLQALRTVEHPGGPGSD